jgi:acyl dehydratase
MRYFEDLEIGEERISAPVSLSEAQMLAFAREYDPQYFHADPEAAKGSRFGGIIASGAQVFALWAKLQMDVGGDIAWICGLGFEKWRFVQALRPGQSVRAKNRILEKRRSTKDPDRGIVKVRYEMIDDADQPVLSMIGTALVECRSVEKETEG